MKSTIRFGILLVIGLITRVLSAETIAVWVVEAGLPDDRPVEASSAWEDGAMSAAFEADYIVWNIPIRRLADKITMEMTELINSTSQVEADYLLCLRLDYQGLDRTARINRLSPSRVDYRLVQLSIPNKIPEAGSQSLQPSPNGYEDARKAKLLTSELLASLKG